MKKKYILSREINELRKDLLLTNNSLAEKAGIGVDTIYRIQRGNEPAMSTVQALADALDMEAGRENGQYFLAVKEDTPEEETPTTNQKLDPQLLTQIEALTESQREKLESLLRELIGVIKG